MLKFIGLVEDMPEECLYCSGVLLIDKALSATNILKIIKEHLKTINQTQVGELKILP